MNLNEILGEATEYDKKREVEIKKPKSWLKSVSAFANTAGGMLVFGITNDDEVIGLEDIKFASEYISEKIKERISPYPEVIMKLHKLNGDKDILTLNVSAGTETPYYYVGDGTTEPYVRIGNESVPADSTEHKRLVLRGKNTSYDALPSTYNFEDFSFSKLRERYNIWNKRSMPEESFESFGICDTSGILTNAGALLADESPIRHSRLFCTRWNGLDKSGGQVDALDSAEFSGSLITLLNDGTTFVKRNMRKQWYKTPDSRIELPDYCERSVFEALVNGLIHRDYLVNGSEVHIDMFDDRMVIYSPGGMVDGSQIQDLDINTVPSIRRNPLLADIFARLGYMEREGSGFGKIITAYESAANFEPEMRPQFFSNRASFTVTLWNLNYKASQNGANHGANGANHGAENEAAKDERTARIIEYIRNNPRESQAIAASHLGISRRTYQRLLKELVDQGMIKRIGSTRSGKWEIID